MVVVRILGVDPGTVVVGFACVEIDEREPGVRAAPGRRLAMRARNVVATVGRVGATRLVEARAVRLGGRGVPVAARLHALADALEVWIERHAPHEVALEEAFHGKSAQAALRIGEARGVVLAIASRHGLGVHQYPPARIKRSVAGNGAASKEAVARMAARSLGAPPFEGPSDAGDAAAVALCRVEERRAPRLESRGAGGGGRSDSSAKA